MTKKSNPYIVIPLLSIGDVDLQGITHTLTSLKYLAGKSGDYLWVNGDKLVAFKPMLAEKEQYD